jgi:hypothetical protein
MTVTAAQIATLRRMVNEPGTTTYSDALLTTFIETYPVMDETGTLPYYWNYLTTPPTKVANTDWIATYDLHAAAADIWEEKGGVASQDFDLNADGGNYTRSQVYEQYMKQARYHAARRRLGTTRLRPMPRPEPRLHDEDLP